MTNVVHVAVTSMPESVGAEWIIPIVTTLIGAGLGAWLGAVLAFRKDRKLRDEAAEKQDHANAHRMLFVLTQQYQILWNLKQCIGDEKKKEDVDKKPIFAPVNEIRFNTTDFSFKGAHASSALPGLMIAERAYLQALDALQCYNRSHERFVQGLKQYLLEPDKVPSDMVDADLTVKAHLFCELCDAISKSQQRQASVYRKFRQYLQERWPSWAMPENIESLVADFKEVYGA